MGVILAPNPYCLEVLRRPKRDGTEDAGGRPLFVHKTRDKSLKIVFEGPSSDMPTARQGFLELFDLYFKFCPKGCSHPKARRLEVKRNGSWQFQFAGRVLKIRQLLSYGDTYQPSYIMR